METWAVIAVVILLLVIAVCFIYTAYRYQQLTRDYAAKKRENERLASELRRIHSQYQSEMNRLRKPDSAIHEARKKVVDRIVASKGKRPDKPSTASTSPRLQDDDILTQQNTANAALWASTLDQDTSPPTKHESSHSFGGGGSFDTPSPSHHHSSSSDSSSYSSGSDSSSYSSGSDSSSSGGSDSGSW